MATREVGTRLQGLIAEGWPAAEDVRLGQWHLRSSFGLTRRANSALAGGDPGEPLPPAISKVEAFYRERALATRLLVAASTAPSGLVPYLGERGYREEAPTLVQVAPIASVKAVRPRDGWRLEIGATPFAAWWKVHGQAGGEHEQKNQHRYAEMLLAPRVAMAFVTAFDDDEPAAIGQGLAQGDWLGIQSMRTVAAYRRRGAATAVLAALGEWGSGRRCRLAYLAVMKENVGARALYRRAGFTTVDRYAYYISH